jgi:uncharacterized membrane protein
LTGVWITVGALALSTAVMRFAGPLLLGGRALPGGAMSVIELMASALLAALVVVETFGQGRAITLDARAAGVAFAAIALSRRAPMTVAVLGAAVVTALVRALF